jgi:hypothetical protein
MLSTFAGMTVPISHFPTSISHIANWRVVKKRSHVTLVPGGKCFVSRITTAAPMSLSAAACRLPWYTSKDHRYPILEQQSAHTCEQAHECDFTPQPITENRICITLKPHFVGFFGMYLPHATASAVARFKSPPSASPILTVTTVYSIEYA